jgi:hypothetical protein
MVTLFCKIRELVCCLAASIAVHLLFMNVVRFFSSCDFAAPLDLTSGVLVELAVARVNPTRPDSSAKSAEREQPLSGPEVVRIPAVVPARDVPSMTTGTATKDDSPKMLDPETISSPVSPPLKSSTFLASRYEKLTYLISMFGAPVGNAELLATAEDGQLFITLRIRSNELFSAIYPVDTLIETRHVDGRYIMTRIRQREGSFRNDALFTVNLLKKRVSWIEPLNGSSRQLTVPDDAPLDTLSGIYYLRNRQLVIGQTETVHVFDSETYAAVPVEILHREEIRLPNQSSVDTLVVRPLQKTAWIFRHSGDVLIWLTNDSCKTPVKIVTSIALGRITAELVSVESKPADGEIRTASP